MAISSLVGVSLAQQQVLCPFYLSGQLFLRLLLFQFKLARVPLIHSGYKAHQRSSSGFLYPVSSVKERNRKGGKYKISRVLQLAISSPQASPKNGGQG